MTKNKSKLLAFLLAIFTGPLSYLYIGKWKKTLIFLPLMLIPYINILAYLIIIFDVRKEVKNFNRENYDETRFGLLVCKCGVQNRNGSNFCSSCGSFLTKICKSCRASINKDHPFCSVCGTGFDEQIKKGIVRKKTALIAIACVFTLLLFSLTSLVAVEQHDANKYIDTVELQNFQFPEKTGTQSFHIHYELSEKRPHAAKGLKTFITGDVYTNDKEAMFDGKNIEWVVHANKTGKVNFTVTLYDKSRLLDSRQFSIDVLPKASS